MIAMSFISTTITAKTNPNKKSWLHKQLQCSQIFGWSDWSDVVPIQWIELSNTAEAEARRSYPRSPRVGVTPDITAPGPTQPPG